jgi:hypothetical protein
MNTAPYGTPYAPQQPTAELIKQRNKGGTILYAVVGVLYLFGSLAWTLAISYYLVGIVCMAAGIGSIVACTSMATNATNRVTSFSFTLYAILAFFESWNPLVIPIPVLLSLPLVYPMESPKFANFRPFKFVAPALPFHASPMPYGVPQYGMPMAPPHVMTPPPMHHPMPTQQPMHQPMQQPMQQYVQPPYVPTHHQSTPSPPPTYHQHQEKR